MRRRPDVRRPRARCSPRPAALLLAALAAALLAPAAARATVGGPSTLEVLGLTEETGKLFLLRHDGSEAGIGPRALYFRIDLPPERRAPDAPIVIRSWYRGPSADEAEARAARKVAYLRRHLAPLKPADLDGIELSLRYGGLTPCPRQQDRGSEADVERALAERRAQRRAGQVILEDAFVSICRRMTATVRWEGRAADTTLLTWGDVAVRGAWTIPGSERRLVILTHTGVTVESGYASEVALLLPAPAKEAR